ncbi:MAG: hypothetical protein HQL51_07215 [Magnetococcales bacterium]|nr:hypothetical protein [Magnetococcales bacterium]
MTTSRNLPSPRPAAASPNPRDGRSAAESVHVSHPALPALLERVEQHRRTVCDALLEEARRTRGEILRQARREARRRVQRAVRVERDILREQLQEARADWVAERRELQLESASSLVARMRKLLRQALETRWRDENGRRGWIGALIRQALAQLPPGEWTVSHDPAWPPEELAPWRPAIVQRCGAAPIFRAVEGFGGGLRLCREGVCLDGSLERILTHREELDAMLLAMLHQEGP